MANFTITAQRRALNACSADYEREKFAEYLKVKPGKLYLIIMYENHWNSIIIYRCFKLNCWMVKTTCEFWKDYRTL